MKHILYLIINVITLFKLKNFSQTNTNPKAPNQQQINKHNFQNQHGNFSFGPYPNNYMMPFVEPSYFYYQMPTGLPPFPYFNPYVSNFGAMPLMTPRQLQDDQQSIQSLHFDTDNRSEKKITQNRPQSVLGANMAKNEPLQFNSSLNNRNGPGLLIEDMNKLNFGNPNLNMDGSTALMDERQNFNIISKRDENRLTPLLHQLPHVKACFSINSIIKIRPNDPCEGQPALVDITNIGDIMENYFSELKTLNLQKNEENTQLSTENDNFYDNEAIIEARNEIIFNYNLLKEFPGPLAKENTSKTQVIQFCQKKIKECLSNTNINIIDPHSHALLWDYLALLVRQNGIIDLKNDISPLLLSGIGSETLSGLSGTSAETKHTKLATDGDQNKKNLNGENITINSHSQLQEFVVVNNDTTSGIPNELDDTFTPLDKKTQSAQQTEPDEEINKLRQYLGAGQIPDAIEYAIKKNLWSHALFLASSLNLNQQPSSYSSNTNSGPHSIPSITNDQKSLNRVKLRFINSLPSQDPIQTCYQLLIGRVPTVATVIIYEKIFLK